MEINVLTHSKYHQCSIHYFYSNLTAGYSIVFDDFDNTDVVYVEYLDGTIIELNQSSIHTYESESTLVFRGDIIEIEKVQAILINGERINTTQ